jgi:hypothetical protein
MSTSISNLFGMNVVYLTTERHAGIHRARTLFDEKRSSLAAPLTTGGARRRDD